MHLCVLGKESLDELEASVVRHFSELRVGPGDGVQRTHGDGAPSAGSGPWTAAQRGKLLRATPVRETRLLRLMWQLPPERTYAESKAMKLLSSLLSHEGEGGLEWLLTQKVE